MTRIALLDDYQNVALTSADWSSLTGSCALQVFTKPFADEAEATAQLADFEVIVAMRERTRFPRSLLAALPRLRLLVTTGRVNAAIDLATARELGVVVSSTHGLSAAAELAWGLLLALARHIPSEDRVLRAGGWQTTVGKGLRGRTLGLIGLGNVGSRMAVFARAFEMPVLAWSRSLTQETAAARGADRVEFEELLSRSDIVSLHAGLNDRSRHMIDRVAIAKMKPGALLINSSRGPLVDLTAVIDALKRNILGGYAADVFDEEPLPLDHPIKSAPNTVLTPHLGFVTEETYAIYYSEAVENIRAFLAGTPIRVLL